MNVLNFDNNKTPLCEKHASDLEHAIHPQCQFCLTDKLSEYMFHAVEKYEEHKKLKAENEELKKCFESLLGYYCEAIPYLPKELRDELKRNCEAIKKEEGE